MSGAQRPRAAASERNDVADMCRRSVVRGQARGTRESMGGHMERGVGG